MEKLTTFYTFLLFLIFSICLIALYFFFQAIKDFSLFFNSLKDYKFRNEEQLLDENQIKNMEKDFDNENISQKKMFVYYGKRTFFAYHSFIALCFCCLKNRPYYIFPISVHFFFFFLTLTFYYSIMIIAFSFEGTQLAIWFATFIIGIWGSILMLGVIHFIGSFYLSDYWNFPIRKAKNPKRNSLLVYNELNNTNDNFFNSFFKQSHFLEILSIFFAVLIAVFFILATYRIIFHITFMTDAFVFFIICFFVDYFVFRILLLSAISILFTFSEDLTKENFKNLVKNDIKLKNELFQFLKFLFNKNKQSNGNFFDETNLDIKSTERLFLNQENNKALNKDNFQTFGQKDETGSMKRKHSNIIDMSSSNIGLLNISNLNPEGRKNENDLNQSNSQPYLDIPNGKSSDYSLNQNKIEKIQNSYLKNILNEILANSDQNLNIGEETVIEETLPALKRLCEFENIAILGGSFVKSEPLNFSTIGNNQLKNSLNNQKDATFTKKKSKNLGEINKNISNSSLLKKNKNDAEENNIHNLNSKRLSSATEIEKKKNANNFIIKKNSKNLDELEKLNSGSLKRNSKADEENKNKSALLKKNSKNSDNSKGSNPKSSTLKNVGSKKLESDENNSEKLENFDDFTNFISDYYQAKTHQELKENDPNRANHLTFNDYQFIPNVFDQKKLAILNSNNNLYNEKDASSFKVKEKMMATDNHDYLESLLNKIKPNWFSEIFKNISNKFLAKNLKELLMGDIKQITKMQENYLIGSEQNEELRLKPLKKENDIEEIIIPKGIFYSNKKMKALKENQLQEKSPQEKKTKKPSSLKKKENKDEWIKDFVKFSDETVQKFNNSRNQLENHKNLTNNDNDKNNVDEENFYEFKAYEFVPYSFNLLKNIEKYGVKNKSEKEKKQLFMKVSNKMKNVNKNKDQEGNREENENLEETTPTKPKGINSPFIKSSGFESSSKFRKNKFKNSENTPSSGILENKKNGLNSPQINDEKLVNNFFDTKTKNFKLNDPRYNRFHNKNKDPNMNNLFINTSIMKSNSNSRNASAKKDNQNLDYLDLDGFSNTNLEDAKKRALMGKLLLRL